MTRWAHRVRPYLTTENRPSVKTPAYANVDGYIANFPTGTRVLLEQIRSVIRTAVPGAKEGISYQMPAYHFHGPLVYFAGYKNHIGLYPTASGMAAFEKELSPFKTSRGAIQFPLDKPLPLQLIKKIASFKARENLGKAGATGPKN